MVLESVDISKFYQFYQFKHNEKKYFLHTEETQSVKGEIFLGKFSGNHVY